MPTKPTETAPETNGENQGSPLDPQKKYLMDQFGNLMEKVGDGFGGPLQEELINRLEQTIADFHEEVSEMMANLKENAEKRHEKLKEIWNNPDASLTFLQSSGFQKPMRCFLCIIISIRFFSIISFLALSCIL